MATVLPPTMLAFCLCTASATAMTSNKVAHASEGASSARLPGRPLLFVPGTFEDDSDNAHDLSLQPGSDDVLYDHMPKAGGTFLKRLFRAAVPRDHYQIRSEFSNLTQEDVNSTFVIGSVRAPCDYYVSLWSYGVERGGAMMAKIPKEDRWVYAATSENKDSPEDIEKFRAWVKLVDVPNQSGIMSVRFAQSYGVLDKPITPSAPPFQLSPEELEIVADAMSTDLPKQRVDCWVKLEDVAGTATNCLNAWKDQTSLEVNWDGFHEVMATGDNPIKASSHGACADYFNDETKATVTATEWRIFDMFDYTSCCA